MEISTSSLIAAGQGFSTLNKRADSTNSESKVSQPSQTTDSVEISSDVLFVAGETAKIQSQPQPETESDEVVVELEVASNNAEAIVYQNAVQSADVATQILGNSADITV